MYINFPVMLAAATLIVLLFSLFRIFRSKIAIRRVLAEALFVYYLAALFCITLFPDFKGGYSEPFKYTFWINLNPFESIRDVIELRPEQFRTQIGGNFLLLLPLGLLAPALFPKLRSFKMMLLLTSATSVGIELLQFLEVVLRISSRSVDIDDVLLNVAGAMAGYLVFLLGHRIYSFLRKGKVESAESASKVSG